MSPRPFAIITCALLLLFLPAAFFTYTLIPLNPEQYLTHTAQDVYGYFSRDPTGGVIELAYAGFSRAEILKGRIPLWSPYQSLGHPFIAVIPSSAVFAPLNVLRLLVPSAYWDSI